MTHTIARHGETTVLYCSPDGALVASEADAVDLIGETYGTDASVVVLPVERLDDRFFTLRTRLAGDIVAKFVNYRIRLAILGDISERLAASETLRAFVHEANRGKQFWFVADNDELLARL
ncbi:DUF4180 domain-containing protein [Actinokineospora sp. NBRC 105648]|uniref:DUF4180 domain-containing protein n=1 Tax=Actinokineospora sp. NBRC 105648 TaxID=3032206 RepID=UPI0024A33FF0|nr:DUF4180 domain-containing protein [Actinokineospora sp. NBRC 105648]GLZ36867.1 hypothetical protein Acsp05_04920 [Actinokineospora sp. NBRC 105648]